MCSLGLGEEARQLGRFLSSEAMSSKCESILDFFSIRFAKPAQKVIAIEPCESASAKAERSESAGSEKLTLGNRATTALSRTSERDSVNSCFETACAMGK